MTSFDVDSSPTAIAVIARQKTHAYSSSSSIISIVDYTMSKQASSAVEEHHLLISNVDGRGNSDKGMVNTTLM